MSSSAPWTPILRNEPGKSKRAALVEAIVEAIERGELPEGYRLPPHRELAHRLAISVQTVSASYQEVQRLGLLRSVVGSGSFVTGNGSEKDGTFISSPTLDEDGDLSVLVPSYTAAHERAMRDVMSILSRAENRTWMQPSRPIVGLQHHRDIAGQWLRNLDVVLPPNQIFITNGATHGILLALRAVTRPGDVVLTEHLTENGIIGAAKMLGLTLHGVDTDEEGIIPAALEAACQKYDPAALVWVPTFGNPTCHLALAGRREEIAQVAARFDIAVIEDEIHKPMLEQRLPSITSLLPKKGFFVTGLSKSVVSGLRVGYLCAPNSFSVRLAGLMRSTTWNTAPLLAEIATQLMIEGTLGELIEVQRHEAGKRYRMLNEIMAPHLARSHPRSLSAWLRIPAGWDETALVANLRENNLVVTSSIPFRVGSNSAETGIRVCLGGPPTLKRLKAVLLRLRSLFDQLPT